MPATSVGAGEPLPAALYIRPEAFQRERVGIFRSAWLLLARTEALRNPGDYVAQSLGGWPVLAIAHASGALAAFRNVCRHQKLPLFDAGVGHCEQIRCRYHGWTYDVAGRFLSAPPQVAPGGELSHDLERVAAARLHGLLFVHVGEDPPPLEGSLPVLAPALVRAVLETHAFQAETVTDIEANWKLVMEQALTARSPGVARVAEWPCLILDVAADGAVLHQVIARSFHRTRIHHHHYGAAALAERVAAQVLDWRAGAAARQAALEAGAAAPLEGPPELASFRARFRAVHADEPSP